MDILAWPKKHKWQSLLILLLIVAIGALAYDAIVYRLDKRAWFQAKESIDTIYADIVAKAGQPDDISKSNSCGRFRGEFGEQGPITCEIDVDFIYPFTNVKQAGKLKNEIRGIVNSHNDIWLSSQATSQDPFIPESEGGPGSDYYITPKNIECNAYYDFTPSFNTQMKLKDVSNGNKQFYISLSCTDQAKGKYFSD
jgi:hypothetical protein